MTIDLDTRLAHGNATHTDVVEYLIAHYYNGVRHLALSLLGDAEEADDVAQQTMIQAANKIDVYQPHTNLKAWVYQFGVNIARTQLRKRSARQRLQQVLQLDTGRRQMTPEEAAMVSERNQQLWFAVKKLSTKHRFPIILRYSFDFSTQEIAQILDVPHGTVRSRLHYAERKLHGLLTAEEVTR